MTHQVLARKWRPGRFEDLVGQPHVVRALSNALNSQRLHHAYLFAGTRGVGKTTLARIVARCLNCETGVTATPCGVCQSCVEIVQGRHLDLIEVDAASRTGVEDTRQLLDNVSYAPVSGRYKVYLIDEVHMLSEKSFNALLKTLEEPPPHVKFLLATTDPQKLPITVLSRCLQFNLKPMPPRMIADYLQQVLAAEAVHYEPEALLHLGVAAEGSMRDALSLTEQALAYSNARITETAVSDMLGLLPRAQLSRVLEAAWQGEGAQVLAVLQDLESLAPDWSRVLDELAALTHAVAVEQVLVSASRSDRPAAAEGLPAWLRQMAEAQPAEEIQLAYDILVHAARDLSYAPDPRIGVEMALLRVLAFRPAPAAQTVGTRPALEPSASAAPLSRSSAQDTFSQTQAAPSPGPSPTPPAMVREPAPTDRSQAVNVPALVAVQPPTANSPSLRERVVAETVPASPPAGIDQVPRPENHPAPKDLDWPAFAQSLPPGPVRELALHTVLLEISGPTVILAMEPTYRTMATERTQTRLVESLSRHFGQTMKLVLQDPPSRQTQQTPAARLAAAQADQQAQLEASLQQNPVIRTLQDTFGAEVARVVARD